MSLDKSEISDQFRLQLLGSVAKVRSGYAFKSVDMGTVGLPIIKIKNISPPIVDLSDCERVPENILASIPNVDRYELHAGDILIAMTGATVGKVGRFPKTPEKHYLNQRVGKVYLTSQDSADYRFIYYVLSQDTYVRQISGTADGSAQANIAGSQIEQLKIPLPPLREQQAIACILGALDDKIELNRRRCRTLEAMARAIFQSWFVDFDPVKAKAAVRREHPRWTDEQVSRAACPKLKPEIAALFPDRFEDSPLGPIPAGWRVGTVGEIVTLSRESIVPGDFPDEVFDHYSIPAYDAGQNPARETGSTIKSQKFIVTDDCVLVSKLNPKTPRVWIPEVDESRRRIASTEFLVCRPKVSSGLGREYFYCLACDPTFLDHLTSRASGTSNSHQRVRPQDFLSYEIPLPAAKLASAFNDKVEPILDRVLLIKRESRTLAALRDTLLPKLISGELRVPDAERIVRRAT
jgi:type I restriction enzyme S subunit